MQERRKAEGFWYWKGKSWRKGQGQDQYVLEHGKPRHRAYSRIRSGVLECVAEREKIRTHRSTGVSGKKLGVGY